MSLGYQILVLAVYALAVARLTRLINMDTVADPLRVALTRRFNDARALAVESEAAGRAHAQSRHRRAQARWGKALYFIGCPWCVGMWVALGTAWAPLYAHDHPVVRYLGVVLAVSHLVGVGARLANTEELEIGADDQ